MFESWNRIVKRAWISAGKRGGASGGKYARIQVENKRQKIEGAEGTLLLIGYRCLPKVHRH